MLGEIGVQLLHAGNGGAAETNLGAVTAGLQNDGVVLLGDGTDDADDTADGRNLIADFDGAAHSGVLLVLALLRQIDQNEHEDDDQDHRQQRKQGLGHAGGTSGTQKLNHSGYTP